MLKKLQAAFDKTTAPKELRDVIAVGLAEVERIEAIIAENPAGKLEAAEAEYWSLKRSRPASLQAAREIGARIVELEREIHALYVPAGEQKFGQRALNSFRHLIPEFLGLSHEPILSLVSVLPAAFLNAATAIGWDVYRTRWQDYEPGPRKPPRHELPAGAKVTSETGLSPKGKR